MSTYLSRTAALAEEIAWQLGKSGPGGIGHRIIHIGKRLAQLRGNPHKFLRECKGVVHVGANSGQERRLYASFGLSVLWIEPIPDVFELLSDNIRKYPAQRALNALITDCDYQTYTFHVANNQGESSSILDLWQHKDVWPEVEYVKDIPCTSLTLPTAIRKAGMDISMYDALVMDTQGSEFLVLQGARDILSAFKYIRAEASDFELYKDNATAPTIEEYLSDFNFSLVRKDKYAERQMGGTVYDLLFKREVARRSRC